MFDRTLFLLVSFASITISFPCIAQENIDLKNIPQTEQLIRYRVLRPTQEVFSTPTQPIPPFIMPEEFVGPEGSDKLQVPGIIIPPSPGIIWPWRQPTPHCTPEIESISNDIHNQILELLGTDNLKNLYLTSLQAYENCYERYEYRQNFLNVLNEELGKKS